MAVFALPDKALGIVSSDLGWCHVVLKEYGNNSLDIALTQCTSNKYSGDMHIPSQFIDWYWVDNGEGMLVSVGREVNIK